jgi:murein DD-endopeptidase MepM/ murein hydrolase activator NlpD
MLARAALSGPVLLALCAPLSAGGGQGRADEAFPARVTLASGETLEGELQIKKSSLSLKAPGKRLKLTAADIAHIDEISPFAPLGKEAKARLEGRLARRRASLDNEDSTAVEKLARWCRDQRLEGASQKLYERLMTLDPEHAGARAALGFIEQEGGWRRLDELAEERWQAVDQAKSSELLNFGRWAAKWRIPQGQQSLDLLLQRVLRHKAGLKYMARYTERYRQRTALRLPFEGRWEASLDKTRHHQKKAYAVYALDLMKLGPKGRTHRGRGRKLSDYYSYGAPIFAVADGVVVDRRDGYPDNPIGRVRGRAEKHNGLSIRHLSGEHSFYVHLKKGSLEVALGDTVKAGDKLGEIGNSGASGLPHLHFTLAIPSALSVPWWVRDYELELPSGERLKMRRGRPREGQILVGAP